MTTSVGRESCGGDVLRSGRPYPCLTRNRSTAWPRWWQGDPTGAQAKADALGLELTDLLCVGCNRRLARLIAEGAWTRTAAGSKFSLTSGDEAEVETIDFDQLELLPVVDRQRYANTSDGRMLHVGAEVMPWEILNPRRPDEVWIVRNETVQDRSMPFPERRTVRIRAQLVEPIEYQLATQREQARDEAKRRRANPPLLPVNVLPVRYPRLARQIPQVERLRIDGKRPTERFTEVLELLQRHARVETVGDPPQILLRSRGGNLASDLVELAADLEPYLVGLLVGDPIRCIGAHKRGDVPVAVGLAAPSAPLCERHLTEELPT